MAWMHKCLVALALVLLGGGPGLSAGTAVVVDPEAVVRSAGQQRALSAGAQIAIGDLIQTSNKGHVELLFDDGTKIVVGPGSALLIEDYLLRGDGSAGDLAVAALGGTFRFMTGTSAKERYRITTPTGIVGVRGTKFDLVTAKALPTQVLMYDGSTELRSVSGKRIVIANVCELGEMTEGEVTSLGLTTKLSREERRNLRSRFVYGSSQQSLGDSNRLQAAGKCLLSPLPFTAQFFSALAEQPSGRAGNAAADAPGAQERGPAVGGTQAKPPAKGGDTPTVPPPKGGDTPAKPPADDGGDCAGHSDHNPGHSQNCNK
jgi:hypothetical protein